MKKVLLTGANGFVGSYLSEELRANNYFVKEIREETCDLRNTLEVESCVGNDTFFAAFHLAAVSSVSQCERMGKQCIDDNLSMTLNLMDALKGKVERFIYISSAEVYGKGRREHIETENTVPVSFYGLSKLLCEHSAFFYRRAGMEVIVARPFPHIGVGQSERFVFQSLAKQLVSLKREKIPVLKAGNIKVVRDFLDVRDVVRAYLMLLKKGKDGEIYNITSSVPISIEQGLKIMANYLDINPRIETEEQLIRDYDIPFMHGSFRKLNEHTGWKPVHRIEETLKDIVKYFESRA